MKKIFPLILLLSASLSSIAQTVSFSVPVTPCNNDGVLTANFSGLTPPLNVTWTTHGTPSTTITHIVTGMSDALTGYSGGPVSVLVVGTSSSAVGSFPGMPPLTYTTTTTDEICPALGSVSATGMGGTAPYTYRWFDASTGSVIATGSSTSVHAGRYGVIVTDASGCVYGTGADGAVANVPYVSFSATVTATPANCTDGVATVSAVDPSAVPPLSYLWSNGATTPSISGLSTGNYAVEITDSFGCRATRDTFLTPFTANTVFVPQTTVISIPLTPTPASCTSSDGAIASFVSGGTAPYTYNWSNGATTASQTGLPSGAYYLTVTDANGCIGSAGGSIGTATPISVTVSSSPSLCTSPTGNATVTPAGGTAPYSIVWNTVPAHTGTTATLLAPGAYRFTVTDAVGCIRTGMATINPVNILTTTFSATSPMCTLSDGSVSVMPAGGATPYTYLWSNGATTPSITSVPAGRYSVTVTDAMGCHKSHGYDLTPVSPVGVGLSVSQETCIFANDGAITATPFGGTPPYTYGWSGGGTTSTITGLNHGYYYLHVTDATGCTRSTRAYVGYDATETSCYCTIEGTIYDDVDNNCVQGSGEMGIPHVQVYCSGIGYAYTDASGHYSFKVPSGAYTITEKLAPYRMLSPCQLNDIPVTVTASTGCVHTIDFANTSTPIHNMRISSSSISLPVPGNVAIEKLIIINEGTVTEDSVMTSYQADGQLYSPMFVPSGAFSGSPYLYTDTTISPLAPGESREFIIRYNTPINIPAATVVNFRDTVSYNRPLSTWLDDYTPANNVRNHNTTVVASYDPNFKEVYPKGTGANGIIAATDTVLEYTVHFQNTGTWYAQNIVVIDTLDSDLDWTTLHPVYESAHCQVTLQESGSVKVAKFTFNNINLPPQIFDDLRSNGMFTYTIKTKPGLAVGTQFKNRASIYFDYNEPIVTNTTVNTIGSNGPIGVAVNSVTEPNSFRVFPNPASGSFSAVINSDKAGIAMMNISDMSGRNLIHKKVNVAKGQNSFTTDIQHFAAGIYFVSINNDGTTRTQKLIVIK